MKRRVVPWGAFFLLAFTAMVAPAAESSGEDGTAQAASELVPVPEILSRADRDETFAAGVIRRADSTDSSPRLLGQLEEIAASVDQKHLAQTRAQLRRLPVARLESLSRHWGFDARRLAAWQRELRLYYASTGDDAAEVARRRAEWEASRRALEDTSLPAAMVGRIQSVIEALERAEVALSPRLARQISLGQQGNALGERIQEGRDEVLAAIADIDRRLLRVNEPPLWRLQSGEGSGDGVGMLMQGIGIEARFAKDYARFDDLRRPSRMLPWVLLPLLLWLSWRSRRSGPDSQYSNASRHALQRPLSAWLLLVAMLVLTVNADAPLLVRQLAMVLALVPVLRQLTPQFHVRFAPWPWVITGLYLLHTLGFFLGSNSHLYRLYGLVLALSAAVLAAGLLLRSQRRVSQPDDRVVRFLRWVAWVAVALLVLSAAANVLGSTSLAEMLIGGTIVSAYLALALYAGRELVVALLQALLAGKAMPRFIRMHAGRLEQLLIRLLHVGTAIGWLLFTLENFRVLRPTYGAVKAIFSVRLSVGELSISLGHIVVFGTAVFIAYWLARVVRLVLHDEVLNRMSLPRGVANSIASLSYYALLLLGWMLALSAAGFRLSQLTLLLGALGVGIGFGLQNVVNNFVSGLILMFERPLQPGDIVEIGNTSGRVRDIGMRATTIRTFEGADVVVPNGTVLSANLTNWTLVDRARRIQVNVSVAYGSEPDRVTEVLGAAANGTIGLARKPPPSVQCNGFGPGSLDFTITAWAPDYDSAGDLRSELATRVHAALAEAGIQVPVAQQAPRP